MIEMKNEFGIKLPQLEGNEFKVLSSFIQDNFGIKMPESKRIVLQGRLQKRLKALEIPDFKSYIDYLFGQNGKDEIVLMVNAVSTNKTDFFREPSHFDYLTKVILPSLTSNYRYKKVKIWSAGCSSGEEPYTLAIVLSEYKKQNANIDFSILATDISTDVLHHGANAIYDEEKILTVPIDLRKKYFLRSKDQQQPKVRVIKELRDKVTFCRQNFMDKTYQFDTDFDIIFCRNALIYFELSEQQNIINKFCKHLNQGGYFVLGHSETITNMNVPLKTIYSTISQKVVG